MGKLMSTILIVCVVLLGGMVSDVQSEQPEPEYIETILNCDGRGPDRAAVAVLRAECMAAAEVAQCAAGSIHPVESEHVGRGCMGVCAMNPDCYIKDWGCFLHNCPGE